MAISRTPSFAGQLPVFGPGPDGERSDYRDVPASDRGNEDYSDRGGFGSYSPSEAPFRGPSDVQYPSGYGASAADCDRGYIVPDIRESPAYNLTDYKARSTQPRESSVGDGGNTDFLEDDWEFRSRNNRARGFLTRPRIPTER